MGLSAWLKRADAPPDHRHRSRPPPAPPTNQSTTPGPPDNVEGGQLGTAIGTGKAEIPFHHRRNPGVQARDARNLQIMVTAAVRTASVVGGAFDAGVGVRAAPQTEQVRVCLSCGMG